MDFCISRLHGISKEPRKETLPIKMKGSTLRSEQGEVSKHCSSSNRRQKVDMIPSDQRLPPRCDDPCQIAPSTPPTTVPKVLLIKSCRELTLLLKCTTLD